MENEKLFVPALLTAQWKSLRRGRNGKFRSGRFRDAAMQQLAYLSVNSFYQVINGHIQVYQGDIDVLNDLMRSCRNIF